MRVCFILLTLSLAVPAFGQQHRVFTNADLGKPITWTAPPPTAVVLDGLRARQYMPAPSASGPVFASTGATQATVSPWAWPEPTPARRLDGSLLSDPPAVYGVPYYFSRFDSYPHKR